ncbi:MAG TPA: Zeta toxin family protein [Planctomycetaceae bacterium]|nr:Zeta toxin family protein [Planctomycetaceae bacterium]
MSQSKRTVSVIAGPNGAGKSTFVENYLNRYVDCDEFLNADLIAKGLSPFAPERQTLRASEIFLERLGELEQGQSSFALETTLAGLSYRRRVSRWKQSGFDVTLFFIWLPSEEMAVQRVATRVAQGGHNIPVADIRRRYVRGLQNLTSVYLPIVDNAWVLNGSVTPPEIIWRRLDVEERVENADLWNLISLHNEGEP